MKKFIITESEKNDIRKMYGLIKEDINQELLNYGNNYIDNHNCDEIYNDLVKFQSAVNSGNPEMSDEDKKELDDNLNQMKTFKGLACGRVKKEMKKNFAKQSKEEPEKLKKYMCWFATNITNTNLTSCTEEPKIDDNKSDKKDEPVVNKPVVKSNPTVKTGVTTQSVTNSDDKSGSQMTYQKTQRPSMEVDPFADGGTYSKDIEGFKNWYKGVYGNEVPENSIIKIKNNSAEITFDNTVYIYKYNNTLNSWNTEYEEKTIK
jgi:hypothetical protein